MSEKGVAEAIRQAHDEYSRASWDDLLYQRLAKAAVEALTGETQPLANAWKGFQTRIQHEEDDVLSSKPLRECAQPTRYDHRELTDTEGHLWDWLMDHAGEIIATLELKAAEEDRCCRRCGRLRGTAQ